MRPRAWQGLVKMQEECAELSVELAKLSAYPEGFHPDGRGECIRRVETEMADVVAAIQFFCARHGIVLDWERVDRKVALFTEWDFKDGMSGRGVLERFDGSEGTRVAESVHPLTGLAFLCGSCRDTGRWDNGIECPACGGASVAVEKRT